LLLANVRSEIDNLQNEIHEHKRGEKRYLELTKQEYQMIQDKNKFEEHHAILDQKEKEMFSHLQSRINMLHEKSRTLYRQWGIISTLLGCILGCIGAYIAYFFRQKEIKLIQSEHLRIIQLHFKEQIQKISDENKKIIAGNESMMEYLRKYDLTLKCSQAVSKESWSVYFKRKTISVLNWFTFQRTT
jgi:methyl-accepting chemotaxis protein